MSASTLLAWLVAAAWQSALVGSLLIALAALARSHRVRRVLLCGGLAKFLVPASLTAPFAALSLAGPVAAAPAGLVPPPGSIAASVVLGVWACGVILMIGRLAARHVRLRREIAAATLLREGRLVEEVRAAAAGLGLARLPDVYLTEDRASGPRACGLLRPSILLPVGLGDVLSRDATRVVLAHELAHHRRRDLPLLAFADVVRAVWWFHPIAWLLTVRLRHALEEACDDLVLDRSTTSRDTYGEALLSVARYCVAPGTYAAAGFAAHPLRRRLQRIILGEPVPGGRWTALAASVLVLVLLPGAPRGAVPGGDEVVRVVEVIVRPVDARTERQVAQVPGRGLRDD